MKRMSGIRSMLSRKSRGITLIEMLLYTVVVAGIIGVAFTFYNRQRNSDYMTRKPQEMQALLGSLEAARMANGGAYPASSSPIDLVLPSNPQPTGTAQLLAAALGTDNREYKGWTYSCAGDVLSVRINVGDTSNKNLRVAVNRAIHNNLSNQGWNCGPDGYDGSQPSFTCTRPAVCR